MRFNMSSWCVSLCSTHPTKWPSLKDQTALLGITQKDRRLTVAFPRSTIIREWLKRLPASPGHGYAAPSYLICSSISAPQSLPSCTIGGDSEDALVLQQASATGHPPVP